MKSFHTRTTKGKGLVFLFFIFFGYIAGIISKFTNESYMANFSHKWYVVCFYILTLVMVTIDLILYVRNYHLDKAKEAEEQATMTSSTEATEA